MSTSRTAAVLVAACLVTACSAGGADLVGEVGSVPPEATAPDAVHLPLDAYRPTTWESGQVLYARAVLIARCQGSPLPDRAAVERATLERIGDFGPLGNERRYGLTSAEDAAAHGYHLPSSAVPPPARGRGGPTRPDCVRAADADLGLGGTDLVARLGAGSFRRSLGLPELTRATSAWADCMAGLGFDHDSPMDAMAGFDLTGPTAGERERATAVADVRCKDETGLVATWQGVEAAIQTGAIAEHRPELDRAATAHRETMAAARVVIASTG